MVFIQSEKCHNDGVSRPPIRDNDLEQYFPSYEFLKVKKGEKVKESKKSKKLNKLKVENVHVGASVVPRGYLFKIYLSHTLFFCIIWPIFGYPKPNMKFFLSHLEPGTNSDNLAVN